VWAVGRNLRKTNHCIEHWAGHRWTFARVPIADCGYVAAVATAPNGEAWAVGRERFHRTGRQWKRLHGYFRGGFEGVAAISRNDVWAVGSELPNENYEGAFRVHWDGHSWTIVASPWLPALTPTSSLWDPSSEFDAIAALSATDIWVVGGKGNAGSPEARSALIEHYSCASG
jgi:hypothetical protein